MSYQQTRTALDVYDFEPTSGSADMVRVAFWLEAPTNILARIQNPTVDDIRAVLKLSEEHDWYANGSFCRKCGTQIGSGQPCR